MPIINVEGIGRIEFPDAMSREEIDAAIKNEILPVFQRRAAAASPDAVAALSPKLDPGAASIGANPFSKGTARVDTNFKIGDSYSYREIDLYTKLETRNFKIVVTEITDNEVIFNNGVYITDLFGNHIKLPDGRRFTQAQFFIAEYSVGKKWTTRFRVTTPKGTSDVEFEFKVVAREKVTVPAGTFDAYRVEGQAWAFQAGVSTQTVYWIAPGVKRSIAWETTRKHQRSGKVLENERRELTAYLQQ